MLKSELREAMRNKKRQFSQQQLEELSLPIMGRFLAHERMRTAHTVLMYYSLPDEVNTHKAILELIKRRKQVLLPTVIDGGKMVVRKFEGIQDLREGRFHIMEPTGLPFTDYQAIDLIAVPGMAFSSSGNRLGRGKGYYDRFLAQVPQVYKIGVCFDFQKVETIPTEPTDIPMDEVL